jgi:DNA-binding CsgD family transcriptional regulator
MNDDIIIKQAVAKIAATADELPGVLTVHDLRNWSVAYMSNRGLQELNLKLEDLIGLTSDEYYKKFFNEDDAKDYVPKILGLLERNNNDEIVTFFQQVRFSKNSEWRWHMSSVRILARNMEGAPLLVVVMAFPIDAMHHMAAKAARLLEENNFLRKNVSQFTRLSKREREILALMALGKSSSETAEILFIASTTVESHRKNIRQKLGTNSYFEICQYARAFDLI